MAYLTEDELLVIENLIDSSGLQLFLEGLSCVAGRKAQHIAEAWQDTTTAKRWAALEGSIYILSLRAEGM